MLRNICILYGQVATIPQIHTSNNDNRTFVCFELEIQVYKGTNDIVNCCAYADDIKDYIIKYFKQGMNVLLSGRLKGSCHKKNYMHIDDILFSLNGEEANYLAEEYAKLLKIKNNQDNQAETEQNSGNVILNEIIKRKGRLV